MREIPLALDPEVRPLVRIGWVRAEPVTVAAAGDELRGERDELCSRLVDRYSGHTPGRIEGLAPARELYRAFGIDPTRTRPSSESLLRRVLRGLPFPEVSNAVDLGNFCSLLFLLPIGLFDADRIEGAVLLRRGRPGESYPGIRKAEVHLEGRPVLCDERRPFGNPTSDSLHTAVTEATRSLWMTLFAPRSFSEETLDGNVNEAAAFIGKHLGGKEEVRTSSGVVTEPGP